ncbi:hypothetical protein V1512DRAFT_255593 [Lipomyces arxii]|uniref:uncharacterized protein n=1 Tax=Lipomyces arxii TaxID=56418 RepID=UPI0034CE20B9
MPVLKKKQQAVKLKNEVRLATKNPKLKPYCDVLKFGTKCTNTFRRHNEEPFTHVSVMDATTLSDNDGGISRLEQHAIAATATVYCSERLLMSRTTIGIGTKSCLIKDRKMLRPINSFIGFRTYYSRIFPNIHQNKLSAYLSKAWTTYEHKDFWTRNTAIYCAEPRSKSFVDWLQETAIPPQLDGLEVLTSDLTQSEKPLKKSAKIPLYIEECETIETCKATTSDNEWNSLNEHCEELYRDFLGINGSLVLQANHHNMDALIDDFLSDEAADLAKPIFFDNIDKISDILTQEWSFFNVSTTDIVEEPSFAWMYDSC